MSNQAKDWQQGTYTIRVKGGEVEVSTIRTVTKTYLTCASDVHKKYAATARCAPEDEFNLGVGVSLAMDRLNKLLDDEFSRIEVGDIVTVRYGNLVNICGSDWVLKNVKDPELLVKYVYGGFLENGGKYKVITIAKDNLSPNVIMAYIQSLDEFEDCYVINILGLEKV